MEIKVKREKVAVEVPINSSPEMNLPQMDTTFQMIMFLSSRASQETLDPEVPQDCKGLRDCQEWMGFRGCKELWDLLGLLANRAPVARRGNLANKETREAKEIEDCCPLYLGTCQLLF